MPISFLAGSRRQWISQFPLSYFINQRLQFEDCVTDTILKSSDIGFDIVYLG